MIESTARRDLREARWSVEARILAVRAERRCSPPPGWEDRADVALIEAVDELRSARTRYHRALRAALADPHPTEAA